MSMDPVHSEFFQKLAALCGQYRACIRSNGIVEFLEDMPDTDSPTARYHLVETWFGLLNRSAIVVPLELHEAESVEITCKGP